MLELLIGMVITLIVVAIATLFARYPRLGVVFLSIFVFFGMSFAFGQLFMLIVNRPF